MNENLDLLFDTFSEDATIGGVQVKIVPSSDRETINAYGEQFVAETNYLLCKESDIVDVKVRDTLTFRGKTMYVSDIWRSGNGLGAVYISDSV